jgi:hypothetical protein
MQPLRRGVPYRNREHAVESRHRIVNTPRLERREQHLGIGVTTPRRRQSAIGELATDGLEVIDLAIEDERVPAAGRGHGLVTGGREIDDGQAAEAQRDAAATIGPDTGVIRAAMDQRGRHVSGDGRDVTIRTPDSSDSTHERDSSSTGQDIRGATSGAHLTASMMISS